MMIDENKYPYHCFMPRCRNMVGLEGNMCSECKADGQQPGEGRRMSLKTGSTTFGKTTDGRVVMVMQASHKNLNDEEED